MKLSVLVLCYNFEKYIEQCLLSIVSQRTNFDFEIIVRDDFSTDNSASIIDRVITYYPNIKFIKGNINIGFAKSYEQILNLAKGEYIAYTDGDDYWFDIYKLQKQCDFLDSHPDYTLTCTGYWQKDEETQQYSPDNPNFWLIPVKYDEDFNLPSEDFLSQNNCHYGKVYRNIPHFFDYMYDMPMLDWPMNFELSLKGKVKFLDFPSGVYRRHNSGVYSQLSSEWEINQNKIRSMLQKRFNEKNF
jgi:glycosyltransferase involved in cell wall biosynthesis